jgi:hypothetical protein
METKSFEAPTRSEAVAQAKDWQCTQVGVISRLKLIFPVGEDADKTWKVVIHYDESPTSRPPC